MALTVGDLKNMISDMPDDAEVRLAFQPAYPLEYDLSGQEYFEDTKNNVLYLAEDGQVGYLTEGVADMLGW